MLVSAGTWYCPHVLRGGKSSRIEIGDILDWHWRFEQGGK